MSIGIKMACSLHKLSKRLQCNKMFVIGKLLVNMVLHRFVYVVNVVFRNQIQCHTGKICLLSWSALMIFKNFFRFMV